MKMLIAALGFAAALATTAPAKAATLTFDLQLVTICEGAASCDAPGIDVGFLQSIYSQIDVVVNVLSTVIDNSLILQRDGGGKVIAAETNSVGQLTGGALKQFTDSFDILPGPGVVYDIDPNTVYMAITPDLLEPTLGVAFVDAPGSPFGIVENTAALQGGGPNVTRFTTAVLAHEIGHVLGGRHNLADDAADLMFPSINLSDYNDPGYLPGISLLNEEEIRASALLIEAPVAAVPLPATLPALFAGLMLLGGLRGRRSASAKA